MAQADTDKKYIEDRLALAQCCCADKMYQYILDISMGKKECDLTQDLQNINYLTLAIEKLKCYNPIGSVIEDKKSAVAFIKIITAQTDVDVTITIKNGVTTLATYNINPSDSDTEKFALAIATEINAQFSTTGFSASYSIADGNFYEASTLTIYAAQDLGSAANTYTIEYVLSSGTTIEASDVFSRGYNEVLSTFNNLSADNVDYILQKISEICSDCNCGGSSVVDDSIDQSIISSAELSISEQGGIGFWIIEDTFIVQ